MLIVCGYSSSVEYQLPKLRRRVRFPLSAPLRRGLLCPRHIYFHNAKDFIINWAALTFFLLNTPGYVKLLVTENIIINKEKAI